MEIDTVSVDELKTLLDTDTSIQLIDVREVEEFEDFRAPYAKNFPLSTLRPEKVLSELKLDTNKKLYIICRSGGRSQRACEIFASSGHPQVCNVLGGSLAWQERGFPIEKG